MLIRSSTLLVVAVVGLMWTATPAVAAMTAVETTNVGLQAGFTPAPAAIPSADAAKLSLPLDPSGFSSLNDGSAPAIAADDLAAWSDLASWPVEPATKPVTIPEPSIINLLLGTGMVYAALALARWLGGRF